MMNDRKDYVLNPYLPPYEYVPDGEPHVFGDRVYIYGSHDRFNGKKFCLNDYICYSADVKDLKHWRYEGIIYGKTQDPRMTDGTHELWAPDVVRGKDGRYYLYYCPDDKIKSIGVAVCDEPAGMFEFYGIIHDADGSAIGERPGDTIQFDPGVFIDDDGRIFLYSGNGPRTKGAIGKEPKASVVMELEDDMVTIKTEPKKLLPTLGESEGTGFEGHEFFEASSIRKIMGKYYLVYSSVTLHELCYAISDAPDGGFSFGGVVVSNVDMFPEGNRKPKNLIGNDHGGIECINGKYYIFYHRQTNASMFSRQACAEELEILPDGKILQARLTSCGLNGGPLPGEGTFPASCCCNLYGRHTPTFSNVLAMMGRHPYITQDGAEVEEPVVDEDGFPRMDETMPYQYITNGKNGLTAVYRSFEMKTGPYQVGVTVRGLMKGTIQVYQDNGTRLVAEIPVGPSRDWQFYVGDAAVTAGVHSYAFHFKGIGKLDFKEFEWIPG